MLDTARLALRSLAWSFGVPAAIVVLAWIDWAPGAPWPGRAGFLWASGGLLVSLSLLSTQRELRTRVVDYCQQERGLLLAAGLLVLGWSTSTIGAIDEPRALAEVIRVALVVVFFCFTFVLSEGEPRVTRALAWSALGVVAFHGILLALGSLNDSVASLTFEKIEEHIFTGDFPRFRGLASQPMALGSALFIISGHLFDLPHARLRTWSLGIAVLTVAATLSFAALLLPLVLCLACPLRPGLRALAVLTISCAIVAALWLTPLRVAFGGHVVYSAPLAAGYFHDGMGPRFEPIRHLALPAFELDYHWTVYSHLAYRSLTCLSEHPLGVGGGNFVLGCPVWAMNTVGRWAFYRSAHNSYGALFAEGGWVAILATAVFVATLIQRYQWRPSARAKAAVLLAYLVGGVAGASPYQFTLAALLATSLQRRIRAVRNS